MPRGPSGRMVVEIDPALKTTLYVALNEDGLTLKSWLLYQMAAYLDGRPAPVKRRKKRGKAKR